MLFSLTRALLTLSRLILLLIISQMLKSSVYLLYPAVSFVHGPIKDSSSFCQVTGFISVVSIEASGTLFDLPKAGILPMIKHPHGNLIVARTSIAQES
jgi:hypothetical protein